MRFLLLLVTVCTLSFQANAQQIEWNLSLPAHKSPPMKIWDIAPIDSLHAFIVGDFPRIGYTADGGKSWQYTTVNTPKIDSAAIFSTIHFTDSLHGWAASGRSGIARTIDGGKSWQWSDSVFKQISPIMRWNDMTFVDSLNGWAVGSRDSNGVEYATVTHTTDGGKQWTIWTSNTINRPFISCVFLDTNIGIAGGMGTEIYRTSNGGKSWKTVNNFGANFYISILPNKTIVACSQDGSVTSTDKGLTWVEDAIDNFTTNSFIRFADSLHGIYAGGIIKYKNDGLHYFLTKDGGKTWIPKEYPTEFQETTSDINILSCEFARDGSLWQTDDRGVVLRSLDMGNTWGSLQSYSNVFNYITFNSPLSGWTKALYSYNELLKTPVDGLLLHTVDGGKSWLPQILPDTAKYIFAGPYFLDENTGWCIATTKSGNKTLEKTTDNGISWVTNPTKLSKDVYSLYPISNSVLLLGLEANGSSKWNISNDGGSTWANSKEMENVASIMNISRKTGFGIAIALKGNFLITTNYGVTWQAYPGISPEPSPIITAYSIDSNNWWIGGWPSFIAKTTDAGKTWKDYSAKLNYNNLDIYEHGVAQIEFSGPKIGVAVFYGFAGEWYVYNTTDGGESWAKSPLELLGRATGYVRYLTTAPDGTFWVCGDHGLVMYWKPVVTSVEEPLPMQIPDEVSIYPNPSSTSFRITGIEGVASVRVVNSVGGEVMNIQTVGEKQEVDVSSLPNGLYFVKVRGSMGIVVKPIVISR